MNNRMIEKYVTFDSEARRGLAQIYRGYQMNPRTFQKLKKVARTIADLEGSELVRWEHVAEAVQYRDMTGR